MQTYTYSVHINNDKALIFAEDAGRSDKYSADKSLYEALY